MNKFLAFLVGTTLALSTVTTYSLYKLTHVKDRDILKLDKKFGTPPSNPKYTPVVHLADYNFRPFCTAFIIDANYAVTAAHCIDSEGKLSKEKYRFLTETNEDTGVEVSAVGFEERTDLGLLSGDFNTFHFMKADFVNNGFLAGKLMASCGYPFGQKGLACNPMIVVNNNELVVRMRGFLRNGMSGGPVVDENWVAYGVNFAIGDEYSYVNSLQGLLGLFHID